MKDNVKFCELDNDKICDDCNECDVCDLNENKICDNCGKCIGLDGSDYSEVLIDGVVEDAKEAEEYILDEGTLSSSEDIMDDNIEYIEDIPKLKHEFEENLKEIFGIKSSHSHDCDCGCGHDHSHNNKIH